MLLDNQTKYSSVLQESGVKLNELVIDVELLHDSACNDHQFVGIIIHISIHLFFFSIPFSTKNLLNMI